MVGLIGTKLPMIPASYIHNPIKLKRCTGLTVEQFDELTTRLYPSWKFSEYARLVRPDRQRRIGGGHPYSLKTIQEKLWCLLVWYKLYPNYWFLGLVVSMDAGNVCRLLNRLRPILETAADSSLKDYFKNIHKGRKKIGSWDQLKKEFPDVYEILIDVTEQQIERPFKKQKSYYSGKKKRHTIKTQIVVSDTGRILHVSKSLPGRYHDYDLFKRENVFKWLPREVEKWVDKGYDGILKDFPDHAQTTWIPFKKRRNKPKLSLSERRYNRKVNRKRIKVEHKISHLKKYQLLSQIYRHRRPTYQQDFRNVAALVNFRHGFT